MENYPVPLVLKCIVSGLEVKYYSRPYIEKRIARAGDLATLINTFMAKGKKKKNAPQTFVSKRTWKGEELIKSIKTADKEIIESKQPTAKTGEVVYKYADGGQCRVNFSL